MAVVIETTLGDITVDLYVNQRPITCLNFLKLCKMKYYNYNLFHSIRSGFIAQTGDPTGEGSGGESIWGVIEGPAKRFFSSESRPKIRHTDAGLLSMVCTGESMVGSQFFFTLASNLDSLDGVHCVIGEVSEGHEVLRKLNEVICDETHRPYQDVRITHTVILEDPFNDPQGMKPPSRSPSPSAERLRGGRLAPDEEVDETQGKTMEEIQEMIAEKEAKARATILEIVGDLPDADIAPPENVLFVCKLNPVTADEDLEIIFSRFGKIVTCEVIRDKKSGDSLQYAFIEFADKKSCEDAYFKMDNVLIDDRRIHVDFSQSVSKIKWLGKGRGVQHISDNNVKNNNVRTERTRSHSKEKVNHRSRHDRNGHEKSRSDRYRNEYDRKGNVKRSRSRSPVRNKSRRYSPQPDSRRYNKNEKSPQRETEFDSKKRYRSRSPKTNMNRSPQRNRSRSPHARKNERNYYRTDAKENNELRRSVERNSKHSKEVESSKKRNTHKSQSPTRDEKRHRTDKEHKDRYQRSAEREQNKYNNENNTFRERKKHDTNIDKHKTFSKTVKNEYNRRSRSKEDKNHNKSPKAPHSDDEVFDDSTTTTHRNKAKKNKNESDLTDEKRHKKDKSKNKEAKEKSHKKEAVEKSKPKESSGKTKKDKKRRKYSTSSSSSSSSSSSESSSDSDTKKKKVRRKRKKHVSSESSSSDSESSTSSSSSDSSSESSSSSSDSEPKKKKSRRSKKTSSKSKKK